MSSSRFSKPPVAFFLFILAAVSTLSGCDGSSTPGTESGVDLGPLDTNQDGRLTDDDVELGQSALALTYSPPDGEGKPVSIRHITEDAFILFDINEIMCPPGWGIQFAVDGIDGVEDFSVSVWFHDSDVDSKFLTPGTSDVFVVATDFPLVEHGGTTDGPFATPMTITSSTDDSSTGYFDSEVDVDVGFYAPDSEPTGEGVVVDGVAFRGVVVREPGEPVGRCDDEPNVCLATFEGVCYPSVEEACAAAACATSCNTLDSLPAQVYCAE